MKLGDFLNNIKRVGTKIKLSEFYSEIFFNGTISGFIHWIHSNEYLNRDVDAIYFNDDIYEIVLEEE